MARATVILIGVLGGAGLGAVGVILSCYIERLGVKRAWRVGAFLWLAALVFEVILIYLGIELKGFDARMLVRRLLPPLALLLSWLIWRKQVEQWIERILKRKTKCEQQ